MTEDEKSQAFYAAVIAYRAALHAQLVGNAGQPPTDGAELQRLAAVADAAKVEMENARAVLLRGCEPARR